MWLYTLFTQPKSSSQLTPLSDIFSLLKQWALMSVWYNKHNYNTSQGLLKYNFIVQYPSNMCHIFRPSCKKSEFRISFNLLTLYKDDSQLHSNLTLNQRRPCRSTVQNSLSSHLLVGTVTRLWAEWSKKRGLLPSRGNRFSLFQNLQNSSRDNPAAYSVGRVGLLPQEESSCTWNWPCSAEARTA
jgi:hypothetical protein